MSAEVLDGLARPRVGVVLPAGEDAWTAAVAARTLVLLMLRRLPWARVEVLVDGTVDAAAPSALDCGRPPHPLALDGAELHRLDALIVAGGTAVGGDGDACPVVRLPGSVLDVALLAARAQADDLRRNRLGTLRLLGWLPDADTSYALADAPGEGYVVLPPEAGADEVVAAIAAAREYAGSDPLRRTIASGARPVGTQSVVAAIDAALDTAATAAVECWRSRGAPGALADPAPARHAGTEQARLRVEIRRLEHELEALPLHVNHLESELRTVTSSRTWRYTQSARGLYRAARRRLRD